MACGYGHSLCVGLDGMAWSFGCDNYGQLGQMKNDKESQVPVQIPMKSTVLSVACGSFHSALLTSTGEVWTFGINNYGQLGLGSQQNSAKPKKVKNIPAIHSISCGLTHTVCISKDMEMWSFGRNKYGELGLGHGTRKVNWVWETENIEKY